MYMQPIKLIYLCNILDLLIFYMYTFNMFKLVIPGQLERPARLFFAIIFGDFGSGCPRSLQKYRPQLQLLTQ